MPDEDNEKIGAVSQHRYEEIVAELRDVVEQQTRGTFTIGDRALEVEPMREKGGRPAADPQLQSVFTVADSLHRLAEDIGLAYSTMKTARWAASRWPKDRRQAGVSFTVHRILAHIDDENERFHVVAHPPDNVVRWTPDHAKRYVGMQPQVPVTPQEKVTAIHSLAVDEEVAATVTADLLKRPDVVDQVTGQDKVRAVEHLTRDQAVAAEVTTGLLRRPDVVAQVEPAEKVRVVEELTRDEQVAHQAATGLLRRPNVAFKAMADPTARHQVNHAQAEQGRQAREEFERSDHPAAPVVKRLDESIEFLDLLTACHAFVAAAGRIVPGLRDRQLGGDERDVLSQNVARVRATCDWVETAVDTGKVDMDEALARLLRGE